MLHPEVTLATSGRSNCYIATNQKKALFVERLTSRESTESQQSTDNGQQTTDVEVEKGKESKESIESRER